MPFAAGIDRAHQQQDREHGAQAPRIAGGEPGARQPDAQMPDGGGHAPLVRLPQPRRRHVERHAGPVGERLQRPMRQTAGALDAAAGGDAIDGGEAPRPGPGKDDKGGAENEQDCGMAEARQARQQVEEPEHQKQRDDRGGGPKRRPSLLPPQSGRGEAQLCREEWAKGPGAVGHHEPRLPNCASAGSASHAGMLSRDSSAA